jgi:hypothetical protein
VCYKKHVCDNTRTDRKLTVNCNLSYASNNNRFVPDNLSYVLEIKEYTSYGNASFYIGCTSAGFPSVCAVTWQSSARDRNSRFLSIVRINLSLNF